MDSTGLDGQWTSSNVGATKQAGEPNHAGNSGGASIWRNWVCSANGIVTFNTSGSSFDTLLAVYTGDAFPLALVAQDDDSGPGRTSKLSFPCVSGQLYHVAIDGYAGAQGSTQLNFNTLQKTTSQFDVNEAGSKWTIGGPTIGDPTLNTADYDSVSGAYRVRVFSNSSRYRFPLWYNLKSDWLPYSSIGTYKAVRGKFYVYTTGATSPSAIPNFEMKLSYRFAVTASLKIQTHDSNPNDLALYQELRPNSNPSMPSIYRVDFAPVDVPYLATVPGEGVQSSFGACALFPEDNGYLALTEKQIGTYEIHKTATSGNDLIASQVYTVADVTHASSLDTKESYIPSGAVGGFATVDNSTLGTITNGPLGVSFNTTNIPSNRIGYLSRLFYAGGLTTRMRIDEGEMYKIRWVVSGNRNTSDQAWLWLEQRCVKFGYTYSLQLAGGRTSGTFNNVIARQAIPGIGNQNPDKSGTPGNADFVARGGTYTCLMTSPLNGDIRPDGWPLTTEQRMPLLTAQPKRGVNSASNRDLRVQVKVYDTISFNGGQEASEAADFVVNNVRIWAYPLILD